MRGSLSGLPFLSGLSASSVQFLEKHARETQIATGHLVLREGEPGKDVFFVLSGSVRIYMEGRGKERELARMAEGGFFGEMGILDREGRCASVQAVTDTKIVMLPYVAFDALAEQQPADFARMLKNLARELVRRLRQLDDRFSTIT